ncbi:hypothetical protein EV215_2090, partial [Hypnocyclicus thermotrophus]
SPEGEGKIYDKEGKKIYEGKEVERYMK